MKEGGHILIINYSQREEGHVRQNNSGQVRKKVNNHSVRVRSARRTAGKPAKRMADKPAFLTTQMGKIT